MLIQEFAKAHTKSCLMERQRHLLEKVRTRSTAGISESSVRYTAYVELPRIEAALARLEEGMYGLCTDCRKRIEYRRLERTPEIPTCTDCAGPENLQVQAVWP